MHVVYATVLVCIRGGQSRPVTLVVVCALHALYCVCLREGQGEWGAPPPLLTGATVATPGGKYTGVTVRWFMEYLSKVG